MQPTPPKPPAPPKRRTVATLVWCLVLVVALLVAGSQGVKGAAAPSTAALSMVGGDGYTAWYTDDLSHAMTASVTWARSHGGYDLASSGSDAIGWWVVLTPLDASTVDLARFSWSAGGTGDTAAHGDEVYSLVNGEVRLEVSTDGRVSTIFKGGVLVLPADVHAGSAWTSSGTVVAITDGKPGASFPYTSKGTAVSPSDAGLAAGGCLDVTVVHTIQGASDPSTRTWCPGRGIVRFDIHARGYAIGAPPATSYPITQDPFDWTRLDSAATSTMSLTGASLLAPQYVSRPGVLPDGTVVAGLKTGNDVVAINPTATGTLDHTVWRSHPGGVILTCVTLGQVSVATTSERRIVAYGPTGVVQWIVASPDSVNQPAIAFGGQVVVTSVDGTVMALDPSTGHQGWRTKMPSELAVRPAASGDTMVVIDENGTTVAFGTDGHERWRSTEFPASAYAISGGVVVVNERGASTVRGYDLATGNKLWRAWEPDLVRSFSDLDGVALAYTSGGVKGFDPSTGAVLWSVAQPGLDLLVVGDRAVVATSDSVVVLGRDGTETARIPHGLSRLPQVSIYLAAGTTSVVAITIGELFREVLP